MRPDETADTAHPSRGIAVAPGRPLLLISGGPGWPGVPMTIAADSGDTGGADRHARSRAAFP